MHVQAPEVHHGLANQASRPDPSVLQTYSHCGTVPQVARVTCVIIGVMSHACHVTCHMTRVACDDAAFMSYDMYIYNGTTARTLTDLRMRWPHRSGVGLLAPTEHSQHPDTATVNPRQTCCLLSGRPGLLTKRKTIRCTC